MLSVIIPTRNRALLLKKTLQSLQSQIFPRDKFEVIVVDNGSTDETVAVCEAARTWFPNFVYSFAPRPGLHVGRHRGLKLARGDLLVYGDDDIQAEPSWLAAIANAFCRSDIGLVGGKCIPDYESQPPSWTNELWTLLPEGRMNIFYSLIDLGEEVRTVEADYVFGCNFSIRKSILLRSGGFHPDGMPKHLLRYRGDGETAVSNAVEALGYGALYIPQAAVRHHVANKRMTIDYIYERSFLQGISESYTTIRKAGARGLIRMLAAHEIRNALGVRRFARRSACKDAQDRGYRSGFVWHLRQALLDKTVRDWVMKDSYLDEDN